MTAPRDPSSHHQGALGTKEEVSAATFLADEAATYGDLVLLAMRDVYDDLPLKTAMEQILLKMKNLREELAKSPSLREAQLAPLERMEIVCAEQLERAQASLAEIEPRGSREVAER